MNAKLHSIETTGNNMIQIQWVRTAGDVAAYSTTIATIVQLLPPAAALASLIWFCIQITEKGVGRPFHEILRDLFSRRKG